MQFITCRGCKLPFERKVRTCPNCGELLPGLSRFQLDAVCVAIYMACGLSFVFGCFVGAEVVSRQPGLPLLVQFAIWFGVPPTLAGLSQLLATSVPLPDEALRKLFRWLFGIEGVLIGHLFSSALIPAPNIPKDQLVVSWGLFGVIAVGILSSYWWLRLKREAKTCWEATRRLASEGFAKVGGMLTDIEMTREKATKEIPPLMLAERLAILDQGRLDFRALRASYRACEWQTDLLRWHARLKFYLEGPAPESRTGCEAAIVALDKHGDRGVELLNEWQAADEATYPEPKDCIGRLEQLLDLCGRLRQSILDHQIIIVTRDPRAGAPEDTTFHQLRADLRTLEASIIRSEIQDPWNTAARIESKTALLVAQTEIERELAPVKSEEETETRLLTRVGGGSPE